MAWRSTRRFIANGRRGTHSPRTTSQLLRMSAAMRLYLMSSFDLCGNHHVIEQASRRWRGGRRGDSNAIKF